MALKFALNTGGVPNLCQVLRATTSGQIYDHLKTAGSSGGTVDLTARERDAIELRNFKIGGVSVLNES